MMSMRYISRLISSKKTSSVLLKRWPHLHAIKNSFMSSQVESNTERKVSQNVKEQIEENTVLSLEEQTTDLSESEMSLNNQTMRNPFWNIENDYKNYNPDDIPHFIDDIAPVPPVSFNLAAFANKLPTIQKLIELGVDMSIVEQNPEHAKLLVRLNFENDIQPYLEFLRDNGVAAEDMGELLTRNMSILQEDIENLQIRVNYLESKRFSKEQIARIIVTSPFHITRDTKTIDQRLGFLQETFCLKGHEVRHVFTKQPQLGTSSHRKFLENIFIVKEVMGFSKEQMKELIMSKPKIFRINKNRLEGCFDVLHNVMGLSHAEIMKYPAVFYCRTFILVQRHKYLVHLGRAQYDPKKPCYISLKDFCTTHDDIFCKTYAKTSVTEFNEFLRTL